MRAASGGEGGQCEVYVQHSEGCGGLVSPFSSTAMNCWRESWFTVSVQILYMLSCSCCGVDCRASCAARKVDLSQVTLSLPGLSRWHYSHRRCEYSTAVGAQTCGNGP